MAQLKDFQSGNATYYTSNSDALAVGAGGTGAITATDARINLSAAKSGANSDITSITGLTTALSTTQGGTGAVQKAISNVARTSNVVTITTSTNHGFLAGEYVVVTATTNTSLNGTFLIATASTNTFTYAQSGSNITSVADTGTAVDITYCNLTQNVTGTLSVANGGTGATTNTPNSILVGNDTSAISSIKPGTNNNVLTSTAGSTVNSGSFVAGTEYTILTVGTTDFTLIGASSNTVGVVFTATGVGSGNGTATTNTWTSAANNKLTSSTAQASTSGTSIDFTGIPSWVKRITVILSGVSLSSTANILVQLGTGATPTYTTSGYLGMVTLYTGAATTNFTSGFLITQTNVATYLHHGQMIINNLTSNTWVESSALTVSNNNSGSWGSGSIPLGAALTAIRITSTSTDTFDAGTINIMYD
jgi:hypothetical protein